MTTLYETPAGSPLRFKIEFTTTADKVMYSPSDWNRVLRAGLQDCGDFWIDNYLKMRFEPYARAMGLYTGKKAKGTPLVDTGYLQGLVLSTSRAVATVTSNRARVELVIPLPNVATPPRSPHFAYFNYASNPVVNDSLTGITEQELQRMAAVAAETITGLINGSDKRTVRSQGGTREMLTLTQVQRDSMTHSRKAVHSVSLRRPRTLHQPGKVA